MNTNYFPKEETNRLNIKPRRYDQQYLKYVTLVYMYMHSYKDKSKEYEQTMIKVKKLLETEHGDKNRIFCFLFKLALDYFAHEDNKLPEALFDTFVWKSLPLEHYNELSKLNKQNGVNFKWNVLISRPIIHKILLINHYFIERVLGELDREDNFFVRANAGCL